MDDKNKEEIFSRVTKLIRQNIVKTSHYSKIPHLGSCLSCVDLLVFLYWFELNFDLENLNDPNRDIFVLSKGHGAPALFQVLAERGFFDKSLLDTFGKNGSFFHEHPPAPGYINGIEAATGSLGHGFPMAVGMALSNKIKGIKSQCYVLLSDGECNEGSIWESAMLAPKLKLDNIIAIVDYNKWQATGRSKEIMSLEPLAEKWKAFGWEVQEINGNSFTDINEAFKKKRAFGKPSILISHTIKGKGVSFMEDNNNWHYRVPNEEELNAALKELVK
tara:strand:- start:10684 stop:11508 length:825 start_codon:yes stop_codon:yes gene_type:complete